MEGRERCSRPRKWQVSLRESPQMGHAECVQYRVTGKGVVEVTGGPVGQSLGVSQGC
jgi:hypothetical protein